jgi:3-oxoacyl-[acyl-carrier-protein] synthase II
MLMVTAQHWLSENKDGRISMMYKNRQIENTTPDFYRGVQSHVGNPVAVTGMGMVTAIGTGYTAFWENALAGQSGLSPVSLFDTMPYRCHIGAEVLDFEPQLFLSPDEISKLRKQARMALASARMAVNDAGIDLSSDNPARIGCAMGLLAGETEMFQRLAKGMDEGKPIDQMNIEQFAYPWLSPAAVLSKAFGLDGPCQNIYCACASGNYAIATGCEWIRRADADMVLVGGADAFNQPNFASFHHWRSLAPERCQPFCKGRKGLIVGEGAAVIVLEPLETALAAGRRIHALVLGHGLSCDAYHLTAPHPDGEGAIRAVRAALKDADLSPEQIDYVSAHGTGSMLNDRIETHVLKQVFGRHSPKLLISSIKSMIGHPMGAASAIEAVVCSLAVSRDQVPPTIHLDEPDPECDLNYTANQAVRTPVRFAMNNAFGFGGVNAVVIFGKYEGEN